MEILSALAHIAGSILVLFLLVLGAAALEFWMNDRATTRAREELATKLGVAVADLDRPEHVPRRVLLSSERYSSERFRNRLSDVCGYIRTGWDWLAVLVLIGILIGVLWYTITDNLEAAVGAWWLIAVAIFFWISSLFFSLACKFITGRYPGEATKGRRVLLDFVNSNQELLQPSKVSKLGQREDEW